MSDTPDNSPWICHVCDVTSTSESVACSLCYKTTCAAHLTHKSAYNDQTGLYELNPVCVVCAAEGILH